MQISFTGGQALAGLRIEITPTSSISGHVADQYGDPVASVPVKAGKVTYLPGQRQLRSVQQVLTNDLGEYRLFGLQPGRYFVSAVLFDPPWIEGNTFHQPTPPTLDGRPAGTMSLAIDSALASGLIDERILTGEIFAPIYYVGAKDAATATAIELRPGMSLESIDLTLACSHAYTPHQGQGH